MGRKLVALQRRAQLSGGQVIRSNVGTYNVWAVQWPDGSQTPYYGSLKELKNVLKGVPQLDVSARIFGK